MPFERLFLVANPHGGAGRGATVLEKVTTALAAAGTEVVALPTTHRGHARVLALEVPASPRDALVAIGGDGTVHEVTNGLMGRKEARPLPLGVIAAGTGNSLARDLGVLDVDEACRRIVLGRTRACDLIQLDLDGREAFAFNIVAAGVAASAGATAERLRWLGARRYDVAAVLEILRQRPGPLVVTLDGASHRGRFPLVAFCNTEHTGTGMRLAPGARLDSARVETYLVDERTTRVELLRLLHGVARGAHVHSPLVRHRGASVFSVEGPEVMQLNVNGELREARRLSARVLGSALRLIA